MLKKLSILAAAGLVAWSCSLVKEDRTSCPFTAPVNVHLSGFSYIQDTLPGTRATAVSEYNGVKVLTLAFYDSDGTEVFKSTQDRQTAQSFGTFSTSLPIGSYTMVALGYVLYDDDELTLTSPTQAEYTDGYVRETFAATQAVNVTSTTALNLSATLSRIVTCLQVISTDGRAAGVSKVRMTFTAGGKRFSDPLAAINKTQESPYKRPEQLFRQRDVKYRMTFAAGGKRFSPESGLATVNTGSVSVVGVSASAGSPSTSTGFVFLSSDEQTMDLTIETLDADGNTVFSQTVTNVPFKRNRRTKLSGALYSADASAGSFQLNTTWEEEYTGNF